MRSSVSSELLRSLPSNELCFLVLSLPTKLAPAGVRYYARSDSSPHRTSGVSMAASFRASTLRPDARARPRFGVFLVTRRVLSGTLWPSTWKRPPEFTRVPSEPRHPAKPGGVRDGYLPLPVPAGASASYAAWPRWPLGLIHRFNLSCNGSRYPSRSSRIGRLLFSRTGCATWKGK